MMSQSEIQFPGKQEDEEFQFFYRQHWVRLVWPAVRSTLLSLVLIIGGYVTFIVVGFDDAVTRRSVFIFLLTFFLLVQWEFLIRCYRHFLSPVIVTNRRVHRIRRTLLALSDHDSIDLRQLQELQKVQRGLIQNMFRYGTLHLQSQNFSTSIHFTPHIDWCHAQLLQLREQAKANQAQFNNQEPRSK